MPKPKTGPISKPKPNNFGILFDLIGAYAEARIAESWKGGGSPLEIPIIEAELNLAQAKLICHIDKIRSLLGTQE